MPATSGLAPRQRKRHLRLGLVPAAYCYAIGMTIHGTDHLRRGMATHDAHAAWPGGFQLFSAGVTVALGLLMVLLARSRHPRTPIVAMILGFGSGAMFLLLHLSPGWANFIDTFVQPGSGAAVSGYSWVTAALGVTGCFLLGGAGVRAARAQKESPRNASLAGRLRDLRP